MIHCKSCGRQNEDNYRFCLGCGTPLAAPQKEEPKEKPKAPVADSPSWTGLNREWVREPIAEDEKPWSSAPSAESPPQDKSWSLGGEQNESGKSMWSMGAVEEDRKELGSAPTPVPTPLSGKPGRTAVRAPVEHQPKPKGEAFAPTAAAMPAMTPVPQGPADPISPPSADVDFQDSATSAGVGPNASSPSQPSVPASVSSPSLASAPSPSVPAIDSAPASGQRKCPSCGHVMPTDFVFCGRCGSRYEEGFGAKTMYLSGAAAAAAVAPDKRKVIGRLVALRADGSVGDSIDLFDGETLVGREGGSSFLSSDRLLSPRHACFMYKGGRLYVRDERSLNGVFYKLRDERRLQSGDVFRIGQQLLRFDDVHDIEQMVEVSGGEDTFVLGSPDLGFWGRLVQIVSRSRVGNVFLLSGNEVTLGRERAQVTFPLDGFVSATHAGLVRKNDETFLVDRGSSNGTYVRVSGETPLSYGDLILLGQNLLRVEITA